MAGTAAEVFEVLGIRREIRHAAIDHALREFHQLRQAPAPACCVKHGERAAAPLRPDHRVCSHATSPPLWLGVRDRPEVPQWRSSRVSGHINSYRNVYAIGSEIKPATIAGLSYCLCR